MKTTKLNAWIMGLSMLAVASCSSDNTIKTTGGSAATESELETVINTYVDGVVLPTYSDMVGKVSSLNDKVTAFAANRTQGNLDAACDAWRAAREPWEKSEAFLYGPADYAGLDPSLDSWPLDQNGLDQVLSSGNFNSALGDSEAAISLRGFHTAEYLLFLNGNNRTLAEFEALSTASSGNNAMIYLQNVCSKLLTDTKSLYQAWNNGLGTEEVPIAFGQEFKSHNTARFGSAAVVIGTIIDGCMDIASEVGDAKIGEPHNLYVSGQTEKGLYAVESWYSWNSLTDYTNNIVSIENSYLGGIEGSRNSSGALSTLVASYDQALDVEIRAKITAAKTAINAIPAPFRNSLGNTSKVQAAMDACSELQLSLKKIKAALGID